MDVIRVGVREQNATQHRACIGKRLINLLHLPCRIHDDCRAADRINYQIVEVFHVPVLHVQHHYTGAHISPLNSSTACSLSRASLSTLPRISSSGWNPCSLRSAVSAYEASPREIQYGSAAKGYKGS